MSSALLGSYFWAALCAAPVEESESGRPLTQGSTGLIDRVVFFYEECYIRRGEAFNGKVVAIDGDVITVKGYRTVARVFRVSPALTSERIPLDQNLGGGHRLNQMHLGDMVSLGLAHARDGYVCTALAIVRRPSGTIPEAEDSHLPHRCRLHVRGNFEQFVEETWVPKVIPWMLANLGR